MSTPPPDQPSASPFPPPAPGPGQPAGGYAPIPPQHNPYAQPSPYGPQPFYGPGGQPPTSRGGAGRAVLWAVVGAVVASALWGGGVLLLKSDPATADLRGYAVKNDLCKATDHSAFEPGYTPSSTHTNFTAKGATLDQMTCSESLDSKDSNGEYAYMYSEMYLHRKSDPAPEFADAWLGYKQHEAGDYKVTPVTGTGDEAYLVTEDTIENGSGERLVMVAVRDGWMTYFMRWEQFASSGDGSALPTIEEVTRWVKASTTATLLGLQQHSK